MHCTKMANIVNTKNPYTVKNLKSKTFHISATKKYIEKNSNGFKLIGPKSIITKIEYNFFSWALVGFKIIFISKLNVTHYSVHCPKSNPSFRDITWNVVENMELHEIFRIVSRFPCYISCYITEKRLLWGQCTCTHTQTNTIFRSSLA